MKKTLLAFLLLTGFIGCSKPNLTVTTGDSTKVVDSIGIDFNNANIIGYSEGDSSIIYPRTKITKVK